MKPIRKVYGPYLTTSPSPRRLVIIHYEDGTKKTTAYARHLLEQHLGRELGPDEEADHIDEDPLNDVIENLRPLAPALNRERSAKPMAWSEFNCPVCGAAARKRMCDVKANLKRGCAGPFCGRACARKYQLAQVPQGQREPAQTG